MFRLNKIERYFRDRPVIFWIITSVIPGFFVYLNLEELLELSQYQVSIPLYQFVLLAVLPFLVFIGLWFFSKPTLKREAIKELKGVLAQLEVTIDYEDSNFPARGKTVKKYYHYEILECFDHYNNIIFKLKEKWPRKYYGFSEITKRPRVTKGDWVHQSDMQIINQISLD